MSEISARFWRSVARRPGDACWEWCASKDLGGYGQFWDGSKSVRAHRFAYADTHGSIPRGVVIRHRCDNPRCVRPNHLEPGTPADNVADRVARGRSATGPANGRWKGGAHVQLSRRVGAGPAQTLHTTAFH